jgi:hypothetical protein
MESNLLAVAVLCQALNSRGRMFRPETITRFISSLLELNAGLFKLAPIGAKTPDGFWHKEEERLYTEAQNIVTAFAHKTGLAIALFYNAEMPEQHPGSRLRLEIVRTSHDNRNPMYLQAPVPVAPESTTDAVESKFEHTTEILMHQIGWNIVDPDAPEIDVLGEADTEHIESQLRYGFTSGELAVYHSESGETYRGYWEKL